MAPTASLTPPRTLRKASKAKAPKAKAPKVVRRKSSAADALSVANALGNFRSTHPLGEVPRQFITLVALLFKQGALWLFRFWCLLMYVVMLLPAFVRVGHYYLVNEFVVKNLRFGNAKRNYLDVYIPNANSKNTPTVIFISGGIWIIGYKAWGAFLGRILAFHGITAVMPDYRNYPQGKVGDMVEDVNNAIKWTKAHIEEFGGDPGNIYLMGQSAGAHLGALTLMLKAKEEIEAYIAREGTGEDAFTTDVNHWNMTDIKGFLGVSGPYNPREDQHQFAKRGLPKPVLCDLFGGKELLDAYSPGHMLRTDPCFKHDRFALLFPPTFLFHGTADTCVNCTRSQKFAETLQGLGVKAEVSMYDGKTHTDPIIEDLVYREGLVTKDFMTDVVTVVNRRSFPAKTTRPKLIRGSSFMASSKEEKNGGNGGAPNLCPALCVTMARLFNPF